MQQILLTFFLFWLVQLSPALSKTPHVEPIETQNIELLMEREAERREKQLLQAQQHFRHAQKLYRAKKFNSAEWECDQIWKNPLPLPPALEKPAQSLRQDIFIAQARKALASKNWIKAEVYLQPLAGLASSNPEIAHMQRQTDQARGKLSKLSAPKNSATRPPSKGADHQATFTQQPSTSPESSDLLEEPKRRSLIQTQTEALQSAYLTQARGAWTQPLEEEPPPISTPSVFYTDQNTQAPSKKSIERKLQNIRLPEINFTGATLREAADFLMNQSRKLDPEKTGVSFLVHEDALNQSKPITLFLQNIPLHEAMRYTARLAEVKYKIEEQGVFLLPLNPPYNPLITHEFAVRNQFFYQQDPFEQPKELEENSPSSKPNPSSPSSKLRKTPAAHISAEHVRKALEAKGVLFPEGATAIYSPSTGILTVHNTEDQLEYLEQLIHSDSAHLGQARLIKIETRVLEISQTDLNDLSFNWSIEGGVVPGGFYPGQKTGTHYNFTSTEARTRLGGANALPSSSLENITGAKASGSIGQTISENSLYLSGFLDGTAFTALITALSQKKNVNLISAPAILMKSGGPGALIEIVREFIYPTEFSPPQVYLPSQTDENDALAALKGPPSPIAIPAWPKEFSKEPRKVGIRIKVKKAQADQANQKISLELEPEITDFDGFVDYGSRIYTVVGYGGHPVKTAGPDGQPRQLLSENRIRVPVFTVRSFDGGFKLDVQDGYTMVLGGLIREEIQTINDKVPVLGDVPLLGRLFRSNAQRAIRKNLILFVTPRILQPNGSPLNHQDL